MRMICDVMDLYEPPEHWHSAERLVPETGEPVVMNLEAEKYRQRASNMWIRP
jgi:hypothetical protein